MVTKCIHPRPNPNTVRFGGVAISLTDLCISSLLSLDYLSKILAGKKCPSVLVMTKIATSLGISVDEFLAYWTEACNNPKKKRRPFGPKPPRKQYTRKAA